MKKKIKSVLRKFGFHIEAGPGMSIDLVCGMELDPVHTKLHVEHRGEVYYFCNTVCRNHFVNDPQKYAG